MRRREDRLLDLLARSHPVSMSAGELFNRTHMFSAFLYSALKRLELKGLVEGEILTTGLPGPRQKLYRLTERGHMLARDDR